MLFRSLTSATQNKIDPRSGKLTRQSLTIDNSSVAITSVNFGEKMPQPKQITNQSVNIAPQPLSSTEKATKIELEAILRKPAHTAEEK